MPLPAILLPIIKGLAANGLSTLATAIAAERKEKVEEVIGVKIPDNPAELTGDKLLELRKAAFAHEEALQGFAVKKLEIEADAEKAGGREVTERWRADMTSDSWLSKNVRPLVLIALTVSIVLMAAFSKWLAVEPKWIDLLQISYTTVLAAYFVGRSWQHVAKTKAPQP